MTSTEHRHVPSGSAVPLVAISDLADGRCIAAATDFVTETMHWVICRIDQVEPTGSIGPGSRYRPADPPHDVPVFGTSLALLLDAALDSDGDISHLETGRLNQLDEAHP